MVEDVARTNLASVVTQLFLISKSTNTWNKLKKTLKTMKRKKIFKGTLLNCRYITEHVPVG